MVQEGQGRGSYQAEHESKERAEVPDLAADAEWRDQEVIIAARVARGAGDVGSSGAACANRDRLYWTHSHLASLDSPEGGPRAFCTPTCSDAAGGRAIH